MRKGFKAKAKVKKVTRKKAVKSTRRCLNKKPPVRSSRRNRLPDTAVASRDLSAKYPPLGVWMILEVNDDGETLYERYELLESEIISIFGDDTSFFIPAYIEKVKDKIVGMDLIGGYIFVEKTSTSEGAIEMMTSPYIKGRMLEGARQGNITGEVINSYKKKLLESIKNLAPKKGDKVVPRVGTFKNVDGKVVSVSRDRKSATVVFKKSSRTVQAPVSVLNMDIIE